MNLRPLPGYQHTLQSQAECVPWPVLFPCPFEASSHFEKSAAADVPCHPMTEPLTHMGSHKDQHPQPQLNATEPWASFVLLLSEETPFVSVVQAT